jgi:hypothetical protein
VYPRIGDLTNFAGYPPLNQISSFLWLPPWPQPIIEDGSSIQGRSQDGANVEDFKYLSKEKYPVPTLFFASLLEDEQHLSMGEEVGTVQF